MFQKSLSSILLYIFALRPVLVMLSLIISFLNFVVPAPPAYGASPNLFISAPSAVLFDCKSKQVLFAKNADAVLPFASTTKIMTAIVVLEHAGLQDIVTTSRSAVAVEGTRIYLASGEQKTVEQLLYAALLNSANDAAFALAEHVGGGSVDTFVQMMNNTAKQIGANNTFFCNPTGLDQPGHCSTASDLATIACYAMKIPAFKTIVGTKTLPWSGTEHSATLSNLNRMLWLKSGVTGVKTGFTTQARNCLVTSLALDDRELITVILGSESNLWLETSNLLDYGMLEYKNEILAKPGEILATTTARNGRSVPLTIDEPIIISVPKNCCESSSPEVQISYLPSPSTAAGTQVGWVHFTISNNTYGPYRLVTASSIPANPMDLSIIIGLSLALASSPIVTIAGARKARRRRRRRRRKAVN